MARRPGLDRSGGVLRVLQCILQHWGAWGKCWGYWKYLGIIWRGKYKGQKQKWFVCKFFGLDSEIKLDCHKPEFLDWKWIKPYESLNKVVPFKRKMYQEVLSLFKNHFV